MINMIFSNVLKMSFTAAYCVVIVCIARRLLRKAPKIYSYCLWMVVGLRLIWPFSIQSIFSLVRIPQTVFWFQAGTIGTSSGYDGLTAPNAASSAANTAGVINQYSGMRAQPSLMTVLEWLWLLGIAGLLLYSAFQYLRLCRRLSGKQLQAWQNTSISIAETEGLKTAFVMGIIHPVVYLPKGMPEEEKKLVLAHEIVHIQRKDYLIKLFSFFITCIHWFNPMIWAAYFLMVRDMEMSCDETVVRSQSLNIRKKYSFTLLSMSAGSHGGSSGTLAFGENSIKARIKNVMNFRKPKLGGMIVCILIVTVLSLSMIFDHPVAAQDFGNVVGSEAGEFPGLYAVVNTDVLRVLTQPDGNSQTLSQLYKGDKVQILSFDLITLSECGKEGIEYSDYNASRKYSHILFSGEDGQERSGFAESQYFTLTSDTTDSAKQYWAARNWAEAFCSRDGNTLKSMAADPNMITTWDLTDETGEDGSIIGFGFSSPWPFFNQYMLYVSDSGRAVIYYYAITSDPSATVWSSILNLKISGNSIDSLINAVVTEFTDIQYYDSISSLKDYKEAYEVQNHFVYYDFAGNGFTDAIAGQLSSESSNKEYYQDYQNPETAAARFLHLTEGTASAVISGREATVTWVFPDGSVEIPMYMEAAEPVVWTVKDSSLENSNK